MRVLQLIDSLRPGGAEKMAVNIANALLPHVDGSFLCCTRLEGMLKEEIKPEVEYLFLNKKSSLDPKAILKLRKFIKKNKIDIIHAHSTSYFLAGLIKLSGSKFKLIWHDHYGNSENLEQRDFKFLKKFSRLFNGIISVNTGLKEWAIENLDCNRVIEIKNFISSSNLSTIPKINLQGKKDDFKVICVANLRPQKDHFNLITAFEMLNPDFNITLHLIGEDPGTLYSGSVLERINISKFRNRIFYYGSQSGIINLLYQANLGILASRSEGLPLALLEYGIAGLPVISTNTGKCSEVINGDGKIIAKEDSLALSIAILEYFQDSKKQMEDSLKLKQRIQNNFSEEKVAKEIVQYYLS